MSLFSAAVAAGLILLIRWTYWLIRRREGIGLGDAKLMAMLGAWLGLSGALLSFGIGGVVGAAFAVVAVVARRDSDDWIVAKLPLGTFLCIGGIISALWGGPIIDMYKTWAGF
jgi:leader peptidase (prepilin peptidase)/N-methyltransferase